MEIGLGINTSIASIIILIGPNLPGLGKIFFTGGGYNSQPWGLLSILGASTWLKLLR
jgi:hypothetical protein